MRASAARQVRRTGAGVSGAGADGREGLRRRLRRRLDVGQGRVEGRRGRGEVVGHGRVVVLGPVEHQLRADVLELRGVEREAHEGLAVGRVRQAAVALGPAVRVARQRVDEPEALVAVEEHGALAVAARLALRALVGLVVVEREGVARRERPVDLLEGAHDGVGRRVEGVRRLERVVAVEQEVGVAPGVAFQDVEVVHGVARLVEARELGCRSICGRKQQPEGPRHARAARGRSCRCNKAMLYQSPKASKALLQPEHP